MKLFKNGMCGRIFLSKKSKKSRTDAVENVIPSIDQNRVASLLCPMARPIGIDPLISVKGIIEVRKIMNSCMCLF